MHASINIHSPGPSRDYDPNPLTMGGGLWYVEVFMAHLIKSVMSDSLTFTLKVRKLLFVKINKHKMKFEYLTFTNLFMT